MTLADYDCEVVDLDDLSPPIGGYEDPGFTRYPHKTFAYRCPKCREVRVFGMVRESRYGSRDRRTETVGVCTRCPTAIRLRWVE